MKFTEVLLCGILVSLLNYAPAAARRYSGKKYRPRNKGLKSSPVCEAYSGGSLCEPYLKGQRVFADPSIRSQVQTGNRVDINYEMLKSYVSVRCKAFVLPTLCNFALPPCDPSYSEPTPKKFCRDDCLILKNHICKREFEQASRFTLVSHLLPNCSSMPTVGDPGYKKCIRVVNDGPGPRFKVYMNDITMFENKQVIIKCRLSPKRIKANITWYKDGHPIGDSHRTYKIIANRWGSRVRIRKAKVRDAGLFECVVKGPGGMVTAQAQLKIHGPILPTPDINDSFSEEPRRQNESEWTSSPSGLCERYRGKACADFIGNQTIWVKYRGYQSIIEYKLANTLKFIKEVHQVSDSCVKYGIPAMCYHIFETCDNQSLDSKPRLCREDCFALYSDVCLTELQFAGMDPKSKAVLPDCHVLPTRSDKDHSYCTPLGIPGVGTNTPPDETTSLVIEDHTCYNGTGQTYFGRKSVSKSGRPCQPWPNMDPPGHNFCRNIGSVRDSPWCYVGRHNEMESCGISKCSQFSAAGSKQPLKSHQPVGRTVYVISAIMAVLIVAFLSIIVYLKVQHRKSALPQSDQASSGSISKSTQSTLQQPSFDLKQSISEIKSCVFNQNLEEVSHGKVKFLEALGEGLFAKVCKGALLKVDSESPDVEIAIKRLKTGVPPAAVENFKRETSILAGLQDINVLCLIGVSAAEEPRFMVFEYYTDLDLCRFLVDNASKLSGLIPCDLSEYDLLLDFALQIASGMDFLVEHNFVHRDLAARNVYVAEDNIVKISNLGIGSYKYPGDYSWVHSSALLPVRWMAPEALNALQFSHQTDVWSYGILLWELYTFGGQPYAGLSNQEAIEQVRDLQLLSCPDQCPARMYGLMRECWEEDPSDRAPFSEICSRLREWAGDSIAESH